MCEKPESVPETEEGGQGEDECSVRDIWATLRALMTYHLSSIVSLLVLENTQETLSSLLYHAFFSLDC